MAYPILQTIQLASGYLNNEDNAAQGQSVSPTPTVTASAYAGQLGKIFIADDAQALKLSKTTVGTLRRGVYMLVRTKAGSTASPARGIGAFWDDIDDSVVTPDMAATSRFAGIYVNAPTKGNYTVIQVGGLVTLQVRATVTAGTAGNIAVFTGLTTNTFDGIADGTDYFTTAGALKTWIGQWEEAPTNGGLKLAWIQRNCGYF